jgi:hypothetical protein
MQGMHTDTHPQGREARGAGHSPSSTLCAVPYTSNPEPFFQKPAAGGGGRPVHTLHSSRPPHSQNVDTLAPRSLRRNPEDAVHGTGSSHPRPPATTGPVRCPSSAAHHQHTGYSTGEHHYRTPHTHQAGEGARGRTNNEATGEGYQTTAHQQEPCTGGGSPTTAGRPQRGPTALFRLQAASSKHGILLYPTQTPGQAQMHAVLRYSQPPT